MDNKNTKIILYVLIGMIVLAATFSGGLWTGFILKNITGSLFLPTAEATQLPKTAPSADEETLFDPFWQAWNIVHEQYVDQPLDDTLLMQGAIRGMLSSLGDPHTGYMDPIEFQQANAPLEGEYEGIGAYVDTTSEYLTIISPMPDTPAEAAGLKPGDQVVAIDGEDMSGVSGDLVLRRVLGPAGTDVTLTIRREGTDDFDVTITRAKIILRSVTSEMIEGDIAYINLSSFATDTTSSLRSQLSELLKNQPKGIILDLRNNGGGYLDTAVEVVSQFIGKGVVLIEEYGDGTQQSYEADSNGLATDTAIPLVVLVNEGSASASEITAGAIQDYKRGVLIGAKTYGKGSVQQWTTLMNESGAIRVTVARWLTPQGRQINGIGLTPDIPVELTEEDWQAGRDPQLDRAIQYLSDGK